MPPNINARIKTLRTALFNHIGFILVREREREREREYIITVGVKSKHQNDNDGKKNDSHN